MIARIAIACVLVVGLATPLARAETPPTKAPKAPAVSNTPASRESAVSKAKPKSRRVIIFGTTIVGDVLNPTIDKTVPWQRPAAFQSEAAPLDHDFTTELLTPLDRDAILRNAEEHGP